MGKKKQTQLDKTLNKVYYTPKHAASYGGVQAIERVVAGRKQKKKVKAWLRQEDTYKLHKPIQRNFQRRRVVVGGIDHQWQADLVDVARISKHNKNIKFLLTCIDVLSKYAWVVPLKDKTGKSLVAAFELIFQTGRQPLALQTDKGTEFTNKLFQKFLKDHTVTFFTTHNEETKASIAERFNRTIKTKMWKYFTRHDTLVYHDILQDLVWSYNHTYHRSIKTQPALVNVSNQEEIWQRLYAPADTPVPRFKFRVGDHVRISKVKRTFKKGYLPNWTREIFTVVECRFGEPPVYVLRDEHGDVLAGTFYSQELQKVVSTTHKVYKIEAILNERKKGKTTQHLVKWEGYPTSFNTWLNSRDLRKYKG